MYALFEPDYNTIREKISYHSSLDYVRRTYEIELERMSDYFDRRVYTTPASHILNQIITHLDTNSDISLSSAINALSARAPYIAKSFGLGSEIQYARTLPSHHFLQNNEYLISVEPDVSAIFRARSSKDLKPVRVLWMNSVDYTLVPPIGINHTGADYYSVFSVDIVSLLVKYKMHTKERTMSARLNGLEPMTLGSEHFIASQIMPQLISDILNISVINHATALLKGQTVNKISRMKLPMSIYDNSSRVETCIEYYLKEFRSQQLTYETYLYNIPTISVDNGIEAFKMPKLIKTTQVFWLLMLSRLKLIDFLIELGGAEGVTYNKTLINHLYLESLRLLRENIYGRVLPKLQATIVESYLKKFVDLGKLTSKTK